MKLFKSSSHRQKWNNFLKRYETRSYKKGEIILMQDETPECLRIIKSGVIKTYDIDSSGEERTISFDKIREIFPIGWVFEKIEKTQYFYQAYTYCEIYEIPRADFLKFLRLNPRMGYEMYADMASRFVGLQKRIKALSQPKAPDKIILTLSYLCDRFGTRVDQDTTLVRLALTQQELSDFIGLTRETTSLELKKLEKSGLINYKDKNYLIDTSRLEQITD